MLAEQRSGQQRIVDEADLRTALRKRVRGQEHVIESLSTFIRLQWGKQQRGKPIANLMFVGPPATGKTELAKALAEYFFDDEQNMLRFDCAELSEPHSVSRLVGVQTGIVGAGKGGQLTRPMLANPKQLVMFDEIEKAGTSVLDVLLSVMGEGRLTEQDSGKVVDFTQSLIILTSNAEYDACVELADRFEDTFELGQAVRTLLRESAHFRPELISRLDQVYVFKPLKGIVAAEIVALKVKKAAEEYGVDIDYIAPELVMEMMECGEHSGDIRELSRAVDSILGELLLNSVLISRSLIHAASTMVIAWLRSLFVLGLVTNLVAALSDCRTR